MAPKRSRVELPTPKQRPSLSKLSEREISNCLKRAFESLSEEDQASIKRAIGPLLDIRNMGLASALRVLFVISQGAALDRLDAALTDSVPQDASSVTFSHRSGGNGAVATDRARRD